MNASLQSLIDEITRDPLFSLIVTLCVYQFSVWLQRHCGGNVLINPILVSVTLLVCLLKMTGLTYERYMQGGMMISFLLGPATVALALPLYSNLKSIRRSAKAILSAVIIGSLTTSLTAMLIGHLLGAPRTIVVALGAHSATTPVAMSVSEQLGSEPALAAAFTLLTGLSGVILFMPIMTLLRVEDWRARGLGIGTAAHGLGTARMLQLNETAGAYGGMAIGLGALITTVALPIVVHFCFPN